MTDFLRLTSSTDPKDHVTINIASIALITTAEKGTRVWLNDGAGLWVLVQETEEEIANVLKDLP